METFLKIFKVLFFAIVMAFGAVMVCIGVKFFVDKITPFCGETVMICSLCAILVGVAFWFVWSITKDFETTPSVNCPNRISGESPDVVTKQPNPTKVHITIYIPENDVHSIRIIHEEDVIIENKSHLDIAFDTANKLHKKFLEEFPDEDICTNIQYFYD